MLSEELLEILRCPSCAPAGGEGMLDLIQDSWLVCRDCGRKYPIQDDLPYMLVEIGDKWKDTAVEDLPIPPEIDLGERGAPDEERMAFVADAPARSGTPRWLLVIPVLIGAALTLNWIVKRRSDKGGR